MIKLAAADTKPDLQQILVKRKRKIEDSVRLAKAAEKRRKKMMKVQLESQASPPILLRHPLLSPRYVPASQHSPLTDLREKRPVLQSRVKSMIIFWFKMMINVQCRESLGSAAYAYYIALCYTNALQ